LTHRALICGKRAQPADPAESDMAMAGQKWRFHNALERQLKITLRFLPLKYIQLMDENFA
jgi:hypothetical protein